MTAAADTHTTDCTEIEDKSAPGISATYNNDGQQFKLLSPVPASGPLFSTDVNVYEWRRRELLKYFYDKLCYQSYVHVGVGTAAAGGTGDSSSGEEELNRRNINAQDNITVSDSWRRRPSLMHFTSNCDNSGHSRNTLPRDAALWYLPMLGRMAQLEQEADVLRALGLTLSAAAADYSRRSSRRRGGTDDESRSAVSVKYKQVTHCTGMNETDVTKLLSYGFIGSHARTNIQSVLSASSQTQSW